MEVTQEQIEKYNKLVLDTLQRGTIRNEDKKDLEGFLKYITGNDWTGRCVGCSMTQILNILKAYRAKLEKEANEKTNQTITATAIVDNRNVSNTNADRTFESGETKETPKRKGRPAKQ